MGLLTQILGGLAGRTNTGRSGQGRSGGMSPVLVALLPVLLSMLNQRGAKGGNAGGLGGGIGDLLGRLTQKGYGAQADSWVASGANEALPPQAIDDVFGNDQLHRIAQQAGVGDEEARSGLSELLPDLVDRLTPEGKLPEEEQLSSSVAEYLERLK